MSNPDCVRLVLGLVLTFLLSWGIRQLFHLAFDDWEYGWLDLFSTWLVCLAACFLFGPDRFTLEAIMLPPPRGGE